MCRCVGHNKGSQLPFETQRDSPEESAETVPMHPYICNPLGGPPPIPFAPLAAKPCFSNNKHRTQLIFPPSLLSLQVSHAPFCLKSPKPTAVKQEPAGKATPGHPRLGIPWLVTDAPVGWWGTPVSAPQPQKQIKSGHRYFSTRTGTYGSIRDTNAKLLPTVHWCRLPREAHTSLRRPACRSLYWDLALPP